MEKENIRSRISSLLHLNATKVVHVTYTSDAFNNKADGSQNFSSADILSSVQGKLTSYDAAHSNNVDSVRRNHFSSHAAIANGSWEHNHMKNQPVMTPYHAPHSVPATTPRPIYNNNVDAGMWNEISSDVSVRNHSAPRPVSYPTVTVLIHGITNLWS
ncbi:uncharacterized protein LOC109789181 isoform X2 [Cajanus cajan]|uniref:uncharacterized protein LOC109789181 isoform X2 n=1 Tax=Cajanus cajan TaxID=3821 RepID=UPI0010FB648C|nr:uncharacterized protein LOC109789181 isoform X2 [Cajanus cajan]